MEEENKPKKKITGWSFLALAFYALLGLAAEALLAAELEPLVYGARMRKWTTGQNICHWLLTCIVWGGFIAFVVIAAKSAYSFDIFAPASPMKAWQWLAAALCVALNLAVSYIDWRGFKVVKEFRTDGALKFVFQYIYYAFETGLFLLIIVMAQKAFETWFKNDKIPYGGIAVALTWGLGHILTKSSVASGLLSALSGFIFGISYLLVNRDIKKAYLLSLVMFVL